jgi:hypothetical protein
MQDTPTDQPARAPSPDGPARRHRCGATGSQPPQNASHQGSSQKVKKTKLAPGKQVSIMTFLWNLLTGDKQPPDPHTWQANPQGTHTCPHTTHDANHDPAGRDPDGPACTDQATPQPPTNTLTVSPQREGPPNSQGRRALIEEHKPDVLILTETPSTTSRSRRLGSPGAWGYSHWAATHNVGNRGVEAS